MIGRQNFAVLRIHGGLCIHPLIHISIYTSIHSCFVLIVVEGGQLEPAPELNVFGGGAHHGQITSQS